MGLIKDLYLKTFGLVVLKALMYLGKLNFAYYCYLLSIQMIYKFGPIMPNPLWSPKEIITKVLIAKPIKTEV